MLQIKIVVSITSTWFICAWNFSVRSQFLCCNRLSNRH